MCEDMAWAPRLGVSGLADNPPGGPLSPYRVPQQLGLEEIPPAAAASTSGLTECHVKDCCRLCAFGSKTWAEGAQPHRREYEIAGGPVPRLKANVVAHSVGLTVGFEHRQTRLPSGLPFLAFVPSPPRPTCPMTRKPHEQALPERLTQAHPRASACWWWARASRTTALAAGVAGVAGVVARAGPCFAECPAR